MINLTKIEAYGFKSFADKFELKFDKPITAIVGPNGCGKSNVSDAIRWVLGEQSAKILRGKTMQDLIFAGTEKRKSMSYCEVSLYFDNKERLFPLEFDEVVISRKLYRSGESEYLINKNPSKLKIISDLLRDVGLGREGYSIVGQGRMDAILNAKPDDRRAIFEEALGISKFRVRKVETERKLEKHRDNMARLYDIISELDKQLGPLKQQSEDAKKYLDISEKLKVLEVNAYIYTYDNAYVEKQRIASLIAALQEEKAYAEKKVEEANQYYQDILDKMAMTDDLIKELHTKEVELTVVVERQSSANSVLGEQVKSFERMSDDVLEQIEFNESTIEHTIAKLQELTDELAAKKAEYNKLTAQLQKLNTEYGKVADEVSQMRDASEAAQNERLDILQVLTDKKSLLAQYTTERNSCNERLADIDEQEKEIMQKLADNSEEEKQVVSIFEEAKQSSEKLKEKLDDLNRQSAQNEQSLLDINNQYNATSQNLAVMTARQKFLQASIESFEGFVGSVRQLMKDASANKSIGNKVLGVVANIIKVEKKYEAAIEAVLGNSLQNIVTQTEEDAKALIEYLRANKLGRITFMPLTSIRPRYIDNKTVLRENGCLGITSDFVTVEDKFKPVVGSLLGSSLLIDNMTNAIQISRKYGYAFRMVTLEGDIILPSGMMTGGSRRNESHLLSNEREAEEIKANIAKTKAVLDALKVKSNELAAKKQYIARAIVETNSDYQTIIVRVAAYQERISKFGALSESEQNFVKGISKERKELQEKLNELTVNERNLLAEINSLEGKNTDIVSTSDDELKEYSALKGKRNSLGEQINDTKLKISLLANNITTTEKEISRSKEFLSSTQFDLSNKKEQLEVYKNNIVDLKKKILEGSSDTEKSRELIKVQNQIKETDSLKETLNDERTKADEARTSAGETVNKIEMKIVRAEGESANIDTNLQALQKRMDEIYELTYSQALQYKVEEFDIKAAEKEISKYKGMLTKLGDVNLTSIEGYAAVKERYDDMNAQMEDLKKAEEDQRKIIGELTEEMVTRFNAGFETINNNFTDIFRELFAGGHARLTIEQEEGKDPLDYGIEIEAQPPGKKLQNINLLSGGERSLTAIAILFAIIKLRPMPFCVLDEVEAPLDDANIERFSNYLRKFCASTQFLVITHKKATMENSDVLYGITMEEKGVSKSVSVQLSEAIAIGQE